jgi:hypothetical protein
LIAIIDDLDIKAENVPLVASERDALKNVNAGLPKLRWVEEAKWAQRAKVKRMQGGNNTKYFHLIANRKHRKKVDFFN